MSPRAHVTLMGARATEAEICEAALLCATRPAGRELAHELWSGVLTGTFSVVAAFNARGRRFLVARQNPRSLRRRLALTERQATMLRAIASGRSNKELEAELAISPSTVSTHVTMLLVKLGLRSRAEIARRYACLLKLSG